MLSPHLSITYTPYTRPIYSTSDMRRHGRVHMQRPLTSMSISSTSFMSSPYQQFGRHGRLHVHNTAHVVTGFEVGGILLTAINSMLLQGDDVPISAKRPEGGGLSTGMQIINARQRRGTHCLRVSSDIRRRSYQAVCQRVHSHQRPLIFSKGTKCCTGRAHSREGKQKKLPWDQTARPNQGPEAEVRAKESAAHGYTYTHECDVQNEGQRRQDSRLHMRHPVLWHVSLSLVTKRKKNKKMGMRMRKGHVCRCRGGCYRPQPMGEERREMELQAQGPRRRHTETYTQTNSLHACVHVCVQSTRLGRSVQHVPSPIPFPLRPPWRCGPAQARKQADTHERTCIKHAAQANEQEAPMLAKLT